MNRICKLIVLSLWGTVANFVEAEPLHLLGIGNSFTEMMLYQLPFLLPDSGYGELDLAYLYRPGGNLDQYRQMLQNRGRDCSLFEFDPVEGRWNRIDSVRIDSVLSLKQWDVITVQQSSDLSGMYNTIKPNLAVLLDTVEYYQPSAKIAWHATWSYSRNSQHPGFANYEFSQSKMDYAIEQTARNVKEDFADRIDMVIASQQLIKRLRLTALNDSVDLTSDGFHLAPFSSEAVSDLVYEMFMAPRLGVPVTENPREAIEDKSHSPEDYKLIKQMAYDVCHDPNIWEDQSDSIADNVIYKTEYYTLMGQRLEQPLYDSPIILKTYSLSGKTEVERVILLAP